MFVPAVVETVLAEPRVPIPPHRVRHPQFASGKSPGVEKPIFWTSMYLSFEIIQASETVSGRGHLTVSCQ
jgi:hypothetical protein